MVMPSTGGVPETKGPAMTEASLRTTHPETDGKARSIRRSYIAGGIGAIVAFVFWLLQPLGVFVLFGGIDEDLIGTWEYYQSYPWNGLYEAITFSGIGAGVLAVVVATTRLVAGRGPQASVFAGVGQVLGIAAGIAWFLMAAVSAAPYTSVGFYVNEYVPGATEQAALYEALGLLMAGFGLLFALGMIGWLVSFGFAARRRGIIGWPLAILAFVLAAVTASPFFMPFSAPWGMIAGLGYLLILGVALLVKSRRA
jgi:hypothetical protein